MAFQKVLVFLALFYAADAYGNSVRFQELYCLAKNIYFESRNQPKIGKIAVAQVTLNRVTSSKFPSTVCEVVYQGGERRNRCQFSWYCDGKADEPTEGSAWDESVYLALLVYGEGFLDVTEGALWYHATYASPAWAKHYQKTVRINDHIFYR